MRFEQKAWSPLWLEFSGLPQLLTQKVRGGFGWALFKKVVELDCASNPRPGVVETTLAELATRCGVNPAQVRRALESMRKLEVVACFLPEHEEELALIRVRVPLSTPVPVEEVRAAYPDLFARRQHYFRYASEDYENEATEGDDPILQEIVDLYLGTVGLKMNAFVLDELRLIRTRFPVEAIRRTFRRARQNEIHSLHWIVRELIREKRAQDDTQSEETKDR